MTTSPLRLLLLDPNFVSRIALTSRLEALGFMVRAEKAVSTAARVATSAYWDLIVANVSVPATDIEALLETLSMTEVKTIACVVLDEQDRERKEVALRHRARILLHPVRPRTLVDIFSAQQEADVRSSDTAISRGA
jgi:DNA-binding NarL/FixJ family response regulator